MIDTEQRLERAADRLGAREGHGLPAASLSRELDAAGSGGLVLGGELIQNTCCVWSVARSEEHTSELQSLMRISYAVFCLKKKNDKDSKQSTEQQIQKNN